MGLDCTYQGLPSDSEIISTAYSDTNFAENVFYSVVTNSRSLESMYYFNDIEYSPVKELFKSNPEVKNWCYSPSSRMQQALVYCLNPAAFVAADSFEELSCTFEYEFVHGKRKFSQNSQSGDIRLVRYSPPDFVGKCATYADKITYEHLFANFDPIVMENLCIYKINELSKFEYIYEYFIGLRQLYAELAAHGKASLFITEH